MLPVYSRLRLVVYHIKDYYCTKNNIPNRFDYFQNFFHFFTDVEECRRSKNGYDYMGTKKTTEQGLTCKEGTFCTASANSPAPFCYVDDPDTRWDTCIIPKCSKFKGEDKIASTLFLAYRHHS